MPILLLAAMAVWGSRTEAQTRNNQSDWNVPPPLTPGTITKGSANKNGSASRQPSLTLTDVPAIPQPMASPVQAPLLAAVSSTPPVVVSPDQPVITGQGGLPEMPMPDAPDAPSLPKQTIKDQLVVASSVIDLPLPESPEMPPAPAEPKPVGLPAVSQGPVPVMPGMFDAFSFSTDFGDLLPWSTPVVPESLSFKLLLPTDEKNSKPGSKAINKNKPHGKRRN